MNLVDSHCHLDDPKFAADLGAVLERAAAAGVSQMVSIGTGDGPPGLDRAVRLSERYPQIFATVGVHPHDAAKVDERTFDDLRALGAHEKVVAFGEIGLDYHYDFSPREAQREVFIEQLKVARELDLPLTIHTREAWEDTIAILKAHWSGRPGVMHCFTGGPDQAREALDLGFFLSYGGVTTFRTAENVRESLRITPRDRLLIETDAPYLAPIPWRGKRNEPSFMVETAKCIAGVLGVAPEEIGELTTRNFNHLIKGAEAHPAGLGYTEKSDGN